MQNLSFPPVYVFQTHLVVQR